MQNLKINGKHTPYWCVVVPVDSRRFTKSESGVFVYLHGQGLANMLGFIKLDYGTHELIGCITLSEMDEGVFSWAEHSFLHDDIYEELKQLGYSTGSEGDIDKLYDELKKIIKSQYLERTLSLLTHNQITLTTETKAVVVKQKL